MNNAMKIIVAIAFLTSLWACDPEGCTPADHEISTKFDMGVYSAPGGIDKDDIFNFRPCVDSFKEPLTKVYFLVSLPPEVKLLNGDLYWKGDLSPNSQRCLYLRLHSETDWRKWSSPVNMHVEFTYEGEKIIGDENWSYEDYQKKRRTIWKKNGREIRND